MYENIIIDDTSVYEIDEQCVKCYNSTKKNNVEIKIHTAEKNKNDILIVFEE